ncbi:hypothetical protein SEA_SCOOBYDOOBYDOO_129 [Mycobacterium phage ScoobyDoobyDoo]|nr:hypothetical protein SEA_SCOOBYDOOBYDOO_129 [Mycobacterium phage ScoobyDoobyDoo]
MTVSYTRRSATDVDRQVVAVISVDPQTRVANCMTRVGTQIEVQCQYGVGEAFVIPAVGEQWYIERFDAIWRLYGRVPFNDETLLIEPEEGQVSIGTDKGPLELNGTEVRSRGPMIIADGKVLVFEGGHAYRDNDGSLEHRPADSTDDEDWEPVFGGIDVPVTSVAGRGGNVVLVANDISNATTVGKQVMTIADLPTLKALVAPAAVAAPYDVYYVHSMSTRAVGLGDNTLGIKMQRAATFTRIEYRCTTADATGSTTVQLRRNGTVVATTSLPNIQQVAGVTATGSWSFAEGDILTINISAVGGTPGNGLAVDLKGATS